MAADMHVYYIAYAHPTGVGSCAYNTAGPLTTYEQITAISNELAEHNGLGWVTVTNFQLLSAPTPGGDG